jgi:hypothetical protein
LLDLAEKYDGRKSARRPTPLPSVTIDHQQHSEDRNSSGDPANPCADLMPQTADAALGRVVSVDARARRCLFVGVKQTSLKNAPRTAFDHPKRT